MTRRWTLPSLYNTVVLRSATSVKHFSNALQSSTFHDSKLDPPTPLCQLVKHLGILALGPVNTVQKIISRCTDLRSLACGHSGTLIQSDALLYPKLHERHLLGFSCRDGIPFSQLSPGVTHLHVQIAVWEALPTLLQLQDHLPRLTHLALSIPGTILGSCSIQVILDQVLERNEDLEVVLVQTTDLSEEKFEVFEDRWKLDAPSLDDRVVLRRAARSLVAQWEDGSLFPGGLWSNSPTRNELVG
ncbi:hypothetical protein PQX77_001765 [Marasmius sp. AFHP31]|nr:hypothetical protein PQX77_001765 [Marasmius sp. AFHP31]